MRKALVTIALAIAFINLFSMPALAAHVLENGKRRAVPAKRKNADGCLHDCFGASLATAMLNVMLDVGDKVNQELKTYGANINVVPKEASLLDDLYGVEGGSDQYLRNRSWAISKPYFGPLISWILPLPGNQSKVKFSGRRH